MSQKSVIRRLTPWPVIAWLPLAIIPISLHTPAAQAAPPPMTMCNYLDEHPTIQGMDEVASMLLFGNGLTPEQAAQFMLTEITQSCPRHMFTLQLAIAYYHDAHKMAV